MNTNRAQFRVETSAAPGSCFITMSGVDIVLGAQDETKFAPDVSGGSDEQFYT